jgi:catechol-2,3-dioxygenase
MTATGERGFRVRALGEIAIRCADIERMAAFYRDVIGLTVLSGDHGDGIVFFSLGESYGGHTAVLALFRHDAGRPEAGAWSSLHHLALAVDRTEQAAVMDWYDRHGLDYTVQDFDWIGWRGIFTTDPEGNTVELVAKVKAPG